MQYLLVIGLGSKKKNKNMRNVGWDVECIEGKIIERESKEKTWKLNNV